MSFIEKHGSFFMCAITVITVLALTVLGGMPKQPSFHNLVKSEQMDEAREHLDFVRTKVFCNRLTWGHPESIDSMASRYTRMAMFYNDYADAWGHDRVDETIETERIPPSEIVSGIQQSKINFYAKCRDEHGLQFQSHAAAERALWFNSQT